MKTKYFVNLDRIIIAVLVFCLMLTMVVIPSCGLEWDGSSTGGNSSFTPANVNGFAIRYPNEDCCIGYRFSMVNEYGETRGKVIDVYRDSLYGNAQSQFYKFAEKNNKLQLIGQQNSGFSTIKTSAHCYYEDELQFLFALPGPSGIEGWQAFDDNITEVVHLILGKNYSVYTMHPGEKIIIEPIYNVRLETVYHAVTVTELALYGKHILGENSTGGASWTAETWGFIARYTNRFFPNWLYTPDGQGLWEPASELSANATFRTIINSGYGVGIAYAAEYPEEDESLQLYVTPVMPNASYCKGSLVITSFHVTNEGDTACTDTSGVQLNVHLYGADGVRFHSVYLEDTVVPAWETNLAYFLWYVPEDLPGDTVQMYAELWQGDTLLNSATEIYDLREQYSFDTPDTEYESETPSGFYLTDPPSPEDSGAEWWVWTCTDGEFSLEHYALTVYAEAEITSGFVGEDGTMKSGYGFQLEACDRISQSASGMIQSFSNYTPAQSGIVCYPEFQYRDGENECTALSKISGGWALPLGEYGRTHYTPLWFPDGDYTVHIVLSDIWTPTGMLSVSANAALVIDGNMYDDWYIGR